MPSHFNFETSFDNAVSMTLAGGGGVIIATGVAEARGGQAQLAYDTAGALKPLHAVAMHAILALPALAWLLGFTAWNEQRRVRLVGAAVLIVLTGVALYAPIGT